MIISNNKSNKIVSIANYNNNQEDSIQNTHLKSNRILDHSNLNK